MTRWHSFSQILTVIILCENSTVNGLLIGWNSLLLEGLFMVLCGILIGLLLNVLMKVIIRGILLLKQIIWRHLSGVQFHSLLIKYFRNWFYKLLLLERCVKFLLLIVELVNLLFVWVDEFPQVFVVFRKAEALTLVIWGIGFLLLKAFIWWLFFHWVFGSLSWCTSLGKWEQLHHVDAFNLGVEVDVDVLFVQ